MSFEPKEKQVWRLNTGNGVPNDANGTVYTPKSILPIDSFSINLIKDSLWNIGGKFEIYAYQTKRTKPAKYR